MIRIHKAAQRGTTKISWLDSRHTFSFGDYYDPENLNFRALRVMNDDRVAPAAGFGMHPHKDMEIVTYILAGKLEHRDSLGTGSVLGPGEVQRMSAGTGIFHSEYNASQTEPVHLYQIWLLPEQRGLTPSYEQKVFAREERRGKLRPVVAPDGRDGALRIHQDVEVALGLLDQGQSLSKTLAPGRHAWAQVLTGRMEINGQELHDGDGAAISGESDVTITAKEPGEVMVFDLA